MKGFIFLLITFSIGIALLVNFAAPGDDDSSPDPEEAPVSTTQGPEAIAISQKTPFYLPAKVGVDPAFAKFQTGDYGTSINLLRKRLIANPHDEITKKNLGTALLAFGLLKIKEQKFDEAEKLLEEATALENTDAAITLANLRIKVGTIELGMNVLEDYFEKTKDPEAIMGLIDLSLARDELAKTKFYLLKAENIQTNSEEAKKKIQDFLASRAKRLDMKTAFQAKELVVERGPVQISYPFTEAANFAENIAKILENSLQEIGDTFVPSPPQMRVRAVLVPTEDFRDTTGAPPWAQAIFDGIIRIPMAKNFNNDLSLGRSAILAKHEMFHAYLQEQCGLTIPSWMNEGLAMLVEKRPVERSKMLLRIRNGKSIPLSMASDTYLDATFIDAPNNLIEELYARSHLLVVWLTKSNGNGTSAWKKVITRHCQQRDPLGVVLQEEFGAATALELWKLLVAANEK